MTNWKKGMTVAVVCRWRDRPAKAAVVTVRTRLGKVTSVTLDNKETFRPDGFKGGGCGTRIEPWTEEHDNQVRYAILIQRVQSAKPEILRLVPLKKLRAFVRAVKAAEKSQKHRDEESE